MILGLPEGNLLIDTPPDLRIQLTREGIGIVHAVVFTHAHADHLFGLDDCRIFADYLGRALPVYCQPAVEARIREAFSYAFDDRIRTGPGGGVPRLQFHTLDGVPFQILGASVLPIPLRHGRTTIFGYRFGDLAYCTDTNEIPPDSLGRLEGLDVLVLDCLRHRAHSTHFNLEQALAVVERLRPRRALFTHMCHDLEHQATSALLPAGVELAFDGQVIPLPGLRGVL